MFCTYIIPEEPRIGYISHSCKTVDIVRREKNMIVLEKQFDVDNYRIIFKKCEGYSIECATII